MSQKYNLIDPSIVSDELKQYLAEKKEEYLEILYESTEDGASIEENDAKLQMLYNQVSAHLKKYKLDDVINLYVYVHNQEELHKKEPNVNLMFDDKPVEFNKSDLVDKVKEYRNFHSQRWILKHALSPDQIKMANCILFTETKKDKIKEEECQNER